jgi:hypothetical protein
VPISRERELHAPVRLAPCRTLQKHKRRAWTTLRKYKRRAFLKLVPRPAETETGHHKVVKIASGNEFSIQIKTWSKDDPATRDYYDTQTARLLDWQVIMVTTVMIAIVQFAITELR